MAVEQVLDKELKELGEKFCLRRQEMELSLKDVEVATSIRMNHLQAIERGEISKVISPVYAKGFVEQYATFLGMEGQDIEQVLGQLFPKNRNTQDFTYGIGSVEVRNTPGGGVRWLPNALWGAVLIGMLVGAWSLAKYLGLIS